MIFVTIGENFSIHRDVITAFNLRFGTVAVVEQGDKHIGVDFAANQLVLHNHVAIVFLPDSLPADGALAGRLSGRKTMAT